MWTFLDILFFFVWFLFDLWSCISLNKLMVLKWWSGILGSKSSGKIWTLWTSSLKIQQELWVKGKVLTEHLEVLPRQKVRPARFIGRVFIYFLFGCEIILMFDVSYGYFPLGQVTLLFKSMSVFDRCLSCWAYHGSNVLW